MPAPVYKEGSEPLKKLVDELRAVTDKLKGSCTPLLWSELQTALANLERAALPTVPIARGSLRVGVGLDKASKAIACDSAIAIIKQIKAARAW